MSQRNTVQASSRDHEGPLLELRDVRTHFVTGRGLVRAVDGVSLRVERGQSIGIVGESGSGKTVLSRTMMGLVPVRGVVREGSIRFLGTELVGKRGRELRAWWGKEMAMIFQDPMSSLNPLMRIGEQIAEPLRQHLGMNAAQANETAVQLLRDVRIPSPEQRVRQYPFEMSGGMRQRVMIAIAIACGPTLLFADEPTTALDVTVQAQILELLNEQRRVRNMAMILVTHDLGVVAGHTDRVVVMYGGKVVEEAPTKRLFENVRMPYTEALLRSIPDLGAPSHSRLAVIPGRPPDLVNPPVGCRFAPRCAYAEERCRTDEPPLVTDEDDADHRYACWFPVRVSVGDRPAPVAARPIDVEEPDHGG